MTKLTSYDLTPFYRNTVGLDRLFDRIVNQIDSSSATNYPPYNIERVSDNVYAIVVAVAGFDQDEVTVEVVDDQIAIRGVKKSSESAETEYLHRGLALRDFERQFALAEYMEVEKAEMQNGLLRLTVVRKVPEAKLPRKIAISYQQD